ncbi:MAG: M4 family metallopeptidase, partial [Actinomycetia bacterium]|nr:M4 family metallopeptidase [Actinomycetes bacterium]
MTHVDAHNGEILWRYNDIHFAFEGDSEIDTQVYGLCDGVSTTTIPYLELDVSGAGSTTTDENGDWYIAGGGGTATVSALLQGPYIDVFNYRGTDASFSGSATSGVPFTVDFEEGNSRQDERTTFDAINDVHDFFDLFDDTFGYSNVGINAYVNRTDGYCPGNAWWDGTINFCDAGGSNNNTGELQQVVHHEFGHGV